MEYKLSIVYVVKGVWWVPVWGPCDEAARCGGSFEDLDCSLIWRGGDDCGHSKVALLCGWVTKEECYKVFGVYDLGRASTH